VFVIVGDFYSSLIGLPSNESKRIVLVQAYRGCWGIEQCVNVFVIYKKNLLVTVGSKTNVVVHRNGLYRGAR